MKSSQTICRRTGRTGPASLTGLLCFATLLVLHPSLAQQSGQDREEELKALTAEIGRLTGQLEQQEKERDRERTELQRLEQRIVQLSQEISESETERDTANEALAVIERDIRDGHALQEEHHENLADLVHATWMMGERSYLKMLLNQENPYSLGRALNYYQYISGARSAELEDVRNLLSGLAELQQAHADQVAVLEEAEAGLRSQLGEMEGARQERDQVLAAIESRMESTDERIQRLKNDQQRLSRLVGELARYTTRTSRDRTAAGGFAEQRGRLQMPVPGKVVQEFGNRQAGSGMPSNGLFIDTSEGVDVHAVFRGTVVFADWLRGFGLLVIVDHDDGYMSLYGHNRSLYKSLGESVDTGEIIAESGTTGGLSSPGLYFEIRQAGEPRNPMLWCRL